MAEPSPAVPPQITEPSPPSIDPSVETIQNGTTDVEMKDDAPAEVRLLSLSCLGLANLKRSNRPHNLLSPHPHLHPRPFILRRETHRTLLHLSPRLYTQIPTVARQECI
jgi:hypothetical protein